MSDVKTLQAERTQIFQDVYDNKIPKRVPVNLALPIEPTAQYGGIDLLEAQWDSTKLEDALDKLCQNFYSDIVPGGASQRFPGFYSTLESQSYVMGSNGTYQHPEVVGMHADEYDDLIQDLTIRCWKRLSLGSIKR